MTLEAKQLKAAVETVRMPEGMGERLIRNCLETNAEREVLRDPPAGGRGGRAPRKWWGSLIAACVTLFVVALAGFGLWSAHRETPVSGTGGSVTGESSVLTAGEEAPGDSGGFSGGSGEHGEPSEGPLTGGQPEPGNSGAEDQPMVSICLHGSEELAEMREMALSADDEALNAYLRRLGLLYNVTREDLLAFLETLETLPYLPILPGEPVCIMYFPDLPKVSFTLEGENGDRVELDYEIYFDNPELLMTFLRDLAAEAPSLIDPFPCCDGRVTVYVEARSRTDDGQDFVIWHALADGILVRAIYYTEHPETVVTEELWGGLTVGKLAEFPPEGGSDDPTEEAPGEPPASIVLDGRAGLEEMREMVSSADEETLQAYLWSLPGMGASSREELAAFLELVDALPYLPLPEGEITCIDYIPDWQIAHVVTEATAGDWVRLTYFFYIEDTLAELERWRDPMLAHPSVSCDGRATVYMEWRTEETAGCRIDWWGEADGLFFRAEYHTEHPETVALEDLFASLTVESLAELS